MKCPDCKVELIKERRSETFDFDTGTVLGLVHVRAENVWVERCPGCGLEMSGPAAAGRRSDAILRAVLDAVKGEGAAGRTDV